MSWPPFHRGDICLCSEQCPKPLYLKSDRLEFDSQQSPLTSKDLKQVNLSLHFSFSICETEKEITLPYQGYCDS